MAQGATAVAAPAGTRPVVGLALVGGVLLVALLAGGVDGHLGVFWLLGVAFGVILQRSRLCFASAFRDLFLLGEGRALKALLAGLAVATAGFWLFQQRLVPDPGLGDLPGRAHVFPVGLHTLVAGLLFGFGMVLAGGCVSGTLYRLGEGYIGSWAALGGILVGLFAAGRTWNWWWQVHISQTPLIWLPRWLGFGGALLLTLAGLAGVYLLVLWWEARGAPPLLPVRTAPTPPAFGVRDHLARLWGLLFGRGWPITSGALALGVLNVFAYVFDHPLGVTGELATWSARLGTALGWPLPPLQGLDRLAGCNLVAEGGALLSDSFFLDAGLVVGSLTAAVLAGEFRLRWPRQARRYLQSVAGGVGMGYGAGLATGCTIGAFFSAIPSLSLSGWVFGLALAGGAFLGGRVLRWLA